MKKILTFAVIAIFAANFASASIVTTGMGGKKVIGSLVKTAHSKRYVKISAKEFSLKTMQDTNDVLMQLGIQVAVLSNSTTTTVLAAR